jgi:hypothetical protein
MVEDQ